MSDRMKKAYQETGVLDTPEHMHQTKKDTLIQSYQLAVVKQGLKALLIGMKLNTTYTSTNCRNFVTNLTGTKYPAGKKGLQLALDDIETYLTN